MINSTTNLAGRPGIKENVKYPSSDSDTVRRATQPQLSRSLRRRNPLITTSVSTLSLGLLSLLLESATENVSNSLNTSLLEVFHRSQTPYLSEALPVLLIVQLVDQ